VIGAQRRVLGLIARDGERRLRLRDLRLRGLQRVFLRIELRLADEMLVEQCVIAVALGLRQVAVRLRRTQGCLRAGDLQVQVEWIEFSQRRRGCTARRCSR
jgi:hypothetical protein